MTTKIPAFSYSSKPTLRESTLKIKADGQVVDEFHDPKILNLFYETFGYKADMAMNGVLADEFIWTEYISPPSIKNYRCLQMHIVEFLNTHSSKFRELYGKESKQWLADHASQRNTEELCVTCKLNGFCSKSKMQS